MPRLPQVSGRSLIRLLISLGYEVIRQKGSHIRVRKRSALGEHNPPCLIMTLSQWAP